MVGFYNYTVILTYVSLLISSLGISLAAIGKTDLALYCLIASGVCDMFDGKIARTRKKSTESEKKFGIQLDSLSDIVCFGVLPAVIAGSLIAEPAENLLLTVLTWVFGGLLILCALIRLAYFNVTEEERQATTKARRTSYIGLPVTTSALIFPLAYAIVLLFNYLGWTMIAPFVFPAALIVTAFFFIAPISVRKPTGLYLGVLCFIGACEIAFIVFALLFLQ